MPNKRTPVRGRILENVSRCIALFGTEYALKFSNPCQSVFLFGTVYPVAANKLKCYYKMKVIKSCLNINTGLHHCISFFLYSEENKNTKAPQVHVVVLVCC